MEQTLVDTAILHPADDSIKNEDHQIECKDLIINILPEPEEPPRWPDCCIYRVPKRLREVRKRAYTPRLLSIGPFHYSKRKDQTFKDMEQQKVRYFWYFCKRTGKSNKDELAHIKDEFAHIIQNNEEKIRHCYSEDFRLGRKEFVEMILLDAVFILELFCRKYEKHPELRDQIDYILSQPCMERGIQLDLLLLENQLPFFVLEKLYIFLLEKYPIWDLMGKKPTPIELSCYFFSDLIYHGTSAEPEKEVKHLTDLVRYFSGPPKTEGQKPEPKCCMLNCIDCCCEQEYDKYVQLYYTATKLDEAGLNSLGQIQKQYLLFKYNFGRKIANA